jgi:beta-lactamase class D
MTNKIIYFFVIMLFFSACSLKKATVDNDLKQYFDAKNVDGCFTMLDNNTGGIKVYNMAMDTTRVTPASTFKIINTLIGLETGRIVDENMVIKWDGIKRYKDEWNKDNSMKEAFKVSAVPYYQEVARRIGRDTMKHWIDTLAYGNKNIDGPIDSFWLNNKIKISPDEQLGMLKRLYFDQLPFRKSTQEITRGVMLQEDNTSYKLSYKTGLGFDEQKNALGWLVGWIEENRHVYFFVTLLKSKDENYDMNTNRLEITKNILKHYGFFEGNR